MVISEADLIRAGQRLDERIAQGPLVVKACHDARARRIVLDLSNGMQLAIPVQLIQGLQDAGDAELEHIEIGSAGLGLYWPELDVDVSVPPLLHGITGTRRWMAAQLGAEGGKARSPAKAMASRENGRRGGRPRKVGGTKPAKSGGLDR